MSRGLFRIVAAPAFVLCIAGCVMQGSGVPTAVVTTMRAKVIPADRMKNAVTVGKSTRAEIIASLGETLVISFDTGYEVWVYRLADDTSFNPTAAQGIARTRPDKAWPPTPAEFVILFAPSGVVAKTRVRPAS